MLNLYTSHYQPLPVFIRSAPTPEKAGDFYHAIPENHNRPDNTMSVAKTTAKDIQQHSVIPYQKYPPSLDNLALSAYTHRESFRYLINQMQTTIKNQKSMPASVKANILEQFNSGQCGWDSIYEMFCILGVSPERFLTLLQELDHGFKVLDQYAANNKNIEESANTISKLKQVMSWYYIDFNRFQSIAKTLNMRQILLIYHDVYNAKKAGNIHFLTDRLPRSVALMMPAIIAAANPPHMRSVATEQFESVLKEYISICGHYLSNEINEPVNYISKNVAEMLWRGIPAKPFLGVFAGEIVNQCIVHGSNGAYQAGALLTNYHERYLKHIESGNSPDQIDTLYQRKLLYLLHLNTRILPHVFTLFEGTSLYDKITQSPDFIQKLVWDQPFLSCKGIPELSTCQLSFKNAKGDIELSIGFFKLDPTQFPDYQAPHKKRSPSNHIKGIQYHFRDVGEIIRNRYRILWKAAESGHSAAKKNLERFSRLVSPDYIAYLDHTTRADNRPLIELIYPIFDENGATFHLSPAQKLISDNLYRPAMAVAARYINKPDGFKELVMGQRQKLIIVAHGINGAIQLNENTYIKPDQIKQLDGFGESMALDRQLSLTYIISTLHNTMKTGNPMINQELSEMIQQMPEALSGLLWQQDKETLQFLPNVTVSTIRNHLQQYCKSQHLTPFQEKQLTNILLLLWYQSRAQVICLVCEAGKGAVNAFNAHDPLPGKGQYLVYGSKKAIMTGHHIKGASLINNWNIEKLDTPE